MAYFGNMETFLVGLKGDKGDPGDLDSSQVVQATGQSTTDLMSQKAITNLKQPLVGKNMFNKAKYSQYLDGNGDLKMPHYMLNLIDGVFAQNTQYTVSGVVKQDIVGMTLISISYTDGTEDTRYPPTTYAPFSFTSRAGKTVSNVHISYATSNSYLYIQNGELQVEIGDTATAYEAYKGRYLTDNDINKRTILLDTPFWVGSTQYPIANYSSYDLLEIEVSQYNADRTALIKQQIAYAKAVYSIPFDIPIFLYNLNKIGVISVTQWSDEFAASGVYIDGASQSAILGTNNIAVTKITGINY